MRSPTSGRGLGGIVGQCRHEELGVVTGHAGMEIGAGQEEPIDYRQTSTDKVGYHNRSIGEMEARASFSVRREGDAIRRYVGLPRTGATTAVLVRASRALTNATKIPDFAKPSGQVQLFDCVDE
jgi:hypothetical protein